MINHRSYWDTIKGEMVLEKATKDGWPEHFPDLEEEMEHKRNINKRRDPAKAFRGDATLAKSYSVKPLYEEDE